MARCERNDVIAACYQERIGSDKKRSAGELGYARKCAIDVGFGGSSQDRDLQPMYACSRL